MSTYIAPLPPLSQLPPDAQIVVNGQSMTGNDYNVYQQNGIELPLSSPRATGTTIPAIPSLGDLSAPTYTPEASGVAAATGSVPADTSASGSATGSSGLSSAIYTSRLIILIIGVLLIAAGLFSFKATQTVIQTGARVGRRAAELAG